jgi:hypothetical protein
MAGFSFEKPLGENQALFLMNVIMFIIRVLKLLSMQGKYIVLVLVVIFMCTAPVAGSLSKIAAGAPVYIGESNLDISSALKGCHTIAWWKNGTDTSAPPAKNITVLEINTASETASGKILQYTISPEIFSNYTGTWYCEDKKPNFVVFEVLEPHIDIRVWDLDHNLDVSGKSVPVSTNITYRIDTNLFTALKPLNRPDGNPTDSFFTVSLINPLGQGIGNIYTGNAGNAKTQILSFDNQPFITASPYYWKSGKDWDRTARNAVAEPLYPTGTYTFTVSQNLNNMKETYATRNVTDSAGKITQTATVTFVKVDTPVTPPASVQPVVTTMPMTTPPLSQTAAGTAIPASLPVPKKTTYSPLPEWIALLGIVVAGLFMGAKNR